MKRLATAVALLVFVAALPAPAMRCDAKTSCRMAASKAAMSCCTSVCTMTSPDSRRGNDATLAAAPMRLGADPAVTRVTLDLPAPTIAIVAIDRLTTGCSPPDPVLLNEQFRI